MITEQFSYCFNVQSYRPQEQDAEDRNGIIRSINTCLATLFSERCEVEAKPYGSFISGFYSSNSDLDLALTGTVDAGWFPEAHSTFFKRNLPIDPDTGLVDLVGGACMHWPMHHPAKHSYYPPLPPPPCMALPHDLQPLQFACKRMPLSMHAAQWRSRARLAWSECFVMGCMRRIKRHAAIKCSNIVQ